MKTCLVFVLFIISCTSAADSANHKILTPSAKIDLFLEPLGFHKNCSILTKLRLSFSKASYCYKFFSRYLNLELGHLFGGHPVYVFKLHNFFGTPHVV